MDLYAVKSATHKTLRITAHPTSVRALPYLSAAIGSPAQPIRLTLRCVHGPNGRRAPGMRLCPDECVAASYMAGRVGSNLGVDVSAHCSRRS